MRLHWCGESCLSASPRRKRLFGNNPSKTSFLPLNVCIYFGHFYQEALYSFSDQKTGPFSPPLATPRHTVPSDRRSGRSAPAPRPPVDSRDPPAERVFPGLRFRVTCTRGDWRLQLPLRPEFPSPLPGEAAPSLPGAAPLGPDAGSSLGDGQTSHQKPLAGERGWRQVCMAEDPRGSPTEVCGTFVFVKLPPGVSQPRREAPSFAVRSVCLASTT